MEQQTAAGNRKTQISGNDVNENEAETLHSQSTQELWFREEERWELTWPIWHMLSRSERKTLADKHGYKTIGEFEEFMSLQRAVGDSSTTTMTTTSTAKPYDNNLIYSTQTQPALKSHEEEDQKPRALDEEEDDQYSAGDKLEDEMESERVAATDRLAIEELVLVGGYILMLPEEMLHRIFDWLPVDAYATLALVSPHWKSFTRTETVYRRLCERLYLNQSKRRMLHLSRFGKYRTMLEMRPRVRAGGGVYTMKYSTIIPISRDMFTDIPKGAILESIYYRYLYFQEDGRVLYALTAAPPHEMFPRFLRVCLTREDDRDAVWGTFQVQKRHVTVIAKQAWQYVKFELTIHPNNLHGRFGLLSCDSHVTNKSGNFGDYCPSQVVFEAPSEPFRFVRDKRL